MFQITEVLKRLPFFQSLDQEAIHHVVDRLKYKQYQSGEVVCHAGDAGDRMFIIINGEVKVAVHTPEGEENIIANLGSGDHFGEMALLTGEPRSASVITTSATEMFILDISDFNQVIERYPSITLSMGKVMSQRLRRVLQKTAHTKARVTTVSGSLADRSLADILKFCEVNYLNGTLSLVQNGRSGTFQYERGELQKVILGDLEEDEALDVMLGWQEGVFTIEPRTIPVDLLNGSIPGDGAETQDAPALVTGTQPPVAAWLNLDTVLIVNNSMVVQKMLERALGDNNQTVHLASNLDKALHLTQQHNPGIILSGTKLPDGSGIDFLKKLRNHCDTPFIFLTEKRNRALVQSAVKHLPNVFFTESQAIPDILQALEEVRDIFR